jgi:creatinine amidohydrolase
MSAWGRYEELRPRQIDAILAQAPVAYIPWGSLEWHGHQNPIGLDTIKVHHLAMEAASRTGGVVVPPVYAGYQTMKPHARFMHTIEVPAEVIMGLANAYLDQLADEGFKLTVLLMGHYGGEHVKALMHVAENWRTIRGAGSSMRIWAFPEYLVRPEGSQPPADHAGKYETALLMHYRPDLVDLGELPAAGEVVGNEPRLGIHGDDPRQASADLGARLAEEIVAAVVAGVTERLAE